MTPISRGVAQDIPLDRRKGPRRTTATPPGATPQTLEPQALAPRGPDRRQSPDPTDQRLVGVLIPYMRAHSLSQADLAAQLGLSEDDLLDLAWQTPDRDPATIDAIALRYGANRETLAAILATTA